MSTIYFFPLKLSKNIMYSTWRVLYEMNQLIPLLIFISGVKNNKRAFFIRWKECNFMQLKIVFPSKKALL